MDRIIVDTQALINSATVLEEQRDCFKTQYTKLYDETASLRSDWKGQASDAFNSRVEGFREGFEEMEKIITGYIESVRAMSRDYEKEEESLAEVASRLTSRN